MHADPKRVAFPFVPEHMDFVLHELMMNGSKARCIVHYIVRYIVHYIS